jgi:hypothetical protein
VSVDPLAALAAIDKGRQNLGFLSIARTLALEAHGVCVLDPFSTLLSPGVEIGPEVVLFPNLILELRHGGRIRIGAGTRLMPGTRIVADGGAVIVGDHVEIGEDGGFSIRAQNRDSITVGDRARLTGGGILSESCAIGAGAQVLGRIDVRNCRLEAGADYGDPDPDRRGAVLKGAGQARDIDLAQGCVIQAFGLFSMAAMRAQSFFHPKEADKANDTSP